MANDSDIVRTTSGQYVAGSDPSTGATQTATGKDALSGYLQPDGSYHIPSSITSDTTQWTQLVYQLTQAGGPLSPIYGQNPSTGAYQQAQKGDQVAGQLASTGSIDSPSSGGIANGTIGTS